MDDDQDYEEMIEDILEDGIVKGEQRIVDRKKGESIC